MHPLMPHGEPVASCMAMRPDASWVRRGSAAPNHGVPALLGARSERSDDAVPGVVQDDADASDFARTEHS